MLIAVFMKKLSAYNLKHSLKGPILLNNEDLQKNP
ncbi:hypothetical protein MGSAQ_002243 [marine sediment metagenome]|uniref:Uncharacterized protein n=1 Tax=marine sediment metagenome TaxID=412755 RepID=A0A1B6NSE6_9ZZZZ